MRIKFNSPAKSENLGRKRVITKFLLFPKKINHELRWLEKTMWVQQVNYRVKMGDYSTYRKYYWRNVEWLDKYKKEESGNEWLDL